MKILFNLIIYLVSAVIWAPVRLLSLLNDLIAIIILKIVKHRVIVTILLVAFALIMAARKLTIDAGVAKSTFDIQAIILCFKLKYQNGDFDFKLISYIVISAILITITIKYGAVVILNILTSINRRLLNISKHNINKKLVLLQKSIKEKRNKGLYNIELFKEKYMN